MNTKALLLALGLGLATNVYAHPRVISATPAENEILASAPTNIRIEFTERPVAKFSGIELLDARNQAVPLGPSELLAKDSKVLVAPIASKLEPGDYTVVWHAVAADTHRVEGRHAMTPGHSNLVLASYLGGARLAVRSDCERVLHLQLRCREATRDVPSGLGRADFKYSDEREQPLGSYRPAGYLSSHL